MHANEKDLLQFRLAMAKLYFTYSAMNAGKSAVLLQAAHNYRERGMVPMLWTSSVTAPSGAKHGKIISRIGLQSDAMLYSTTTDIFAAIRDAARPLHAVFIDEAQFLTRRHVWQLALVADKLNIPVLCYGLRTDFRGQLFEGSAELLGIADDLREVRTICHCGRKATMVARMDEEGKVVTEGDRVRVEKQNYVSLCRMHWCEAMGRI